jgi:hypothetical protein
LSFIIPTILTPHLRDPRDVVIGDFLNDLQAGLVVTFMQKVETETGGGAGYVDHHRLLLSSHVARSAWIGEMVMRPPAWA